MFYYKNIGENEVPECNRGGNSLKQNPRISNHAASDIGFCVFPRLDSPRGVSGKNADKERTFWCP